MLKTVFSIAISITVGNLFGQLTTSYDHEKLDVHTSLHISEIMSAQSIYEQRWDMLPQPQFWREVMRLSPDSCLVNVASTRQILVRMSIHDWKRQTEAEKAIVKDSLKRMYGVAAEEAIYVTTGKNDFYKFDEVYPSISQGIEQFERNNVDPWYAQAILLIESPGQLKKSSVGAYGAFQLMPAVARAQGLTVNRYVDERKDFNRSAYGASNLLKKICIPEAKRILDAHNLTYDESDLWFRLFVLHIYHAGAGNVAAVVNKIAPQHGGPEVIQAMWQNTAASFGNNSQNYTQLALAAQLILDEMVYTKCDHLYDCAVAAN